MKSDFSVLGFGICILCLSLVAGCSAPPEAVRPTDSTKPQIPASPPEAPLQPINTAPVAAPTEAAAIVVQTPQVAAPAGIANPASVYCINHGGKSEIRTQADGSQNGYCVFPDGSECEEWAFMRGECNPGNPAPVPRLSSIVKDILDRPAGFSGQEVTITGYFRGWDLLGEANTKPPLGRSDWVIKDDSGAIYVAGGETENGLKLDPALKENTHTILVVNGTVKLTDSGQPYVVPTTVTLATP
jgi:uncharacterized protein